MSEAHGEHGPKAAVTNPKPRCKGTTKAGNPCQSTLLIDGEHCVFHAPNGLDPVELGRKGGQRSAIARRSFSKNEQQQMREGRERLREQFESDPEFYDRVKAVYRDALEAVTTCPSCRERALPDHRTRIAAGDSFLAQLYGKPRQDINQNVSTEQKLVIAVPDWWFRIERDRRAKGEHPAFGGTEIVARGSQGALQAGDVAEEQSANGEALDYDELIGD